MLKYILWFIFLVLNPFYFFPSGNPQLSDGIMALLLLFSVGTIRNGVKVAPFNKRALYGFLTYTVLVSLVLFLTYLGSYEGIPMLHCIFYIYNGIVLFFVMGLATTDPKKFVTYTQYGIVFSVGIQIGYYILFGSKNFDVYRPSFFFSTPNQLGYYALLMLSIYLVLNKIRRTNILFFVIVFLSCLFMTLISASKAAVAGILFLCILFLADSRALKGYGLTALIIVTSASYYFVFKNEKGIKQAAYVLERVEQGSKEKDITEWEYRGYDRITNQPYYIILGAGEGMYKRFDTYLKKHEIHSTFGTLIFSYGIPGFTMFLVFFFSMFKGLKIKGFLYIVPVLLYSFTHMGLRFTPFWILLAIFPIVYLYQTRQKAIKKRQVES